MNDKLHFYDNIYENTRDHEIIISEDEVSAHITNINTTKSSAIDGISATALKDALTILIKQITYLYQRSVDTGSNPTVEN